MKMNAWSFLVSRNQSVDYKTIVAPDFIDAAKLRSLLTKVTEGDRTPPDEANVRWIQGSKAGDFSIVFRVIEARAADIGESSGETLKDSFGRGIYLVEGFVIEEHPSFLQQRIKSSHLEQVHAQVKSHYQHFWYTNETAVSDCFPLQKDAPGQTLTLVEQQPYMASPPSRKPGKATREVSSNFLLILITTAIVFILFSLIIGQMFNGAGITGQSKISQGCSYITQLQQIPHSEPAAWLKALEDLEKKNKPATLFVSTVTPQPPLALGVQVKEDEEPTLKQENGTIQMKFHPLQQAMMQLQQNQNSKFADKTTLEVRIIKPQNDKDQCLQRLQTL